MEGVLSPTLLWGLIAVALAFDFLNGLHDAANSIATVVSTRVLKPQYAVLWAAFFNFVAFAVFGTHVAQTVGKGIVDVNIVDAAVIFAALFRQAAPEGALAFIAAREILDQLEKVVDRFDDAANAIEGIVVEQV